MRGMQSMSSNGIKQAVIHKSLAETAAGTFTSLAIEVPNTQNARAVKLDRVLFQIETPENVAATLTEVEAEVGVGDIKAAVDTVGAIDASVPGVAAVANRARYTTTPIGPKTVEQFPNRAVSKHADGKFYITVAVQGSNNVAVKTVKVTAEFTVL